jgi:hypothetical protein
MRTLWVVDSYLDKIMSKTEREATKQTFFGDYKYPYRFETEMEARCFIVQRAEQAVARARKALHTAEARSRRVSLKFAPRQAPPTPTPGGAA